MSGPVDYKQFISTLGNGDFSQLCAVVEADKKRREMVALGARMRRAQKLTEFVLKNRDILLEFAEMCGSAQFIDCVAACHAGLLLEGNALENPLSYLNYDEFYNDDGSLKYIVEKNES